MIRPRAEESNARVWGTAADATLTAGSGTLDGIFAAKSLRTANDATAIQLGINFHH